MVSWILYILMGVQIAFGCAYFVNNFGAEQQFYENINSFLPIEALSFLQLVLAAVSTWYVLGAIGFRGNKYMRGYVCAFLLTVPYLLQMHMARLVWSVSLSAFLWLFGLILETIKSGLSKKRAVGITAAYIAYGVICPGGMWLGGILLAGAFFISDRRKRAHISAGVRLGVSVFLAAIVIFAANRELNRIFPQARSVHREDTPGMAAISRFVWPNFGKHYFFWPEEVKALISEEDGVDISRRAGLTAETLYFRLEEKYGKRYATKLCVAMGRSCLKYRTKETVSEIAVDLWDHFLLPFTIEKNLRGEGNSLTAWNYGRMREHTPILTKYYYRYGFFELPFLLLGSLLLTGLRGVDSVRRLLRKKAADRRLIWFILVLYSVWCTMRSNFPIDYKWALPILFIWYLTAAGGLLEEERV